MPIKDRELAEVFQKLVQSAGIDKPVEFHEFQYRSMFPFRFGFETMYAEVTEYGKGYRVTFSRSSFQTLTQEQIRAVAAHELGHILKGHLASYKSRRAQGISIPCREGEADFAASTLVGSDAMKHTLETAGYYLAQTRRFSLIQTTVRQRITWVRDPALHERSVPFPPPSTKVKTKTL